MLEQIKEANDIKLIDPSEYRELAREIRRFLVRKVSRTGGHLASNLGVVELTMAMHLCCDLPEDKIVWDVGHQCYTHKILTGRQDAFDSLRQYGGMSGFPKRGESECDAMDTGHSSTSISAALGLAKARDLQGRHNKIFAVIGDGALSGGMAYEALNNAARLRSNMIIVLNDNQMSISKNVGGMSNYLGKIRTDTNYTELKQDVENALEKLPHFGNRLTERIRGVKDLIKRIFIPGMLFEDMGITYIGPIDGHDIGQMVTAFNSASKLNAAVIVHVVTQKGKGYPPAQKDPSSFHGVGPFRVSDGTLLHSKKDVPTYTNVFQNVMLETMADREDVVAISAAMPTGTGLAAVAEQYPDRFFDVGIAEEHAVTFAAGLALGGSRPVVALYSTFLQRAYDMLLHDVALQQLHVVLAVDRCGVVGEDGDTHQGMFDVGYLRQVPGMKIFCPASFDELREDLHTALYACTGPAAIRYPRGGEGAYRSAASQTRIREGYTCTIICYGTMVNAVLDAADTMQAAGYRPEILKLRTISPVDWDAIDASVRKTKRVFVFEETSDRECLADEIFAHLIETGIPAVCRKRNLGRGFIPHGAPAALLAAAGLDAGSLTKLMQEELSR